MADISTQFETLMLNFFTANTCDVIDRTDGNKRENDGMPDIEIKDKIYIEFTVANKGEGDDNVEWEPPQFKAVQTFSAVPDEVTQSIVDFAFKRIANRLSEKQTNFVKNIFRLNPKLPRVVALTVNLQEFGHEYSYGDVYEDAFWKLLWDTGSGTVISSNLDGTYKESPQKDGRVVKSNNGSEILSGIFNKGDANYNKISAVLFINPRAVKDATCDTANIEIEEMGLYINKFAEIKITYDDYKLLGSPGVSTEFPSFSS